MSDPRGHDPPAAGPSGAVTTSAADGGSRNGRGEHTRAPPTRRRARRRASSRFSVPHATADLSLVKRTTGTEPRKRSPRRPTALWSFRSTTAKRMRCCLVMEAQPRCGAWCRQPL